jgi:hypothetical protein
MSIFAKMIYFDLCTWRFHCFFVFLHNLLNIYLNVVKQAKEEGYVSPDVMKSNLKDYVEKQKNNENVKYINQNKSF